MSNDLDHLIQEALDEALSSVTPLPERESLQPASSVNYPTSIALAWLLLVIVAAFLYLNPLPAEPDAGIRSIDTRLGASLYHLAYHIESHRQETGELPEYLEPEWTDLDSVQYTKTEIGYLLRGQLGNLDLSYRSGDNPELLLARRGQAK